MSCKMESLTSDTNIIVLVLAFAVFVVVGRLLVARGQDCHLSKRLSLRHIATFLQLSYIHNYLQSHTVYMQCIQRLRHSRRCRAQDLNNDETAYYLPAKITINIHTLHSQATW
jgi:hypothetical protein